MADNHDGGRRFIPRWDGNPGTFRTYVQEVELWAMTEDLNVRYAIAARLVQNLTGAARRACQGMTKAELSPLSPLHDEVGNLIMEGDPSAGITNVLNRLKEKLGPQTTVRKGQSLSEFFRSKRYHRANTERVSDWLTRFEEGLNRLRDDGVDITKVGDLVGWYMLDMCSLSAERRERVLGALPDENYLENDVRRTLLRLFADIHHGEQRNYGGAGGANRFSRRHPEALETQTYT